MPRLRLISVAFISLCTFLLPSSVVSEVAVDSQPLDDLQQLLQPDFVPDNERRQIYETKGGNDLVHDIWAILREFEPTWKDSVISVNPSGVLETGWYYTKIVLKALFMNAPSTKDKIRKEEGDIVTGDLRKAVNILKAAAKFDDPDALFLLAEMNFYGNFSHPRNPKQAFEWYMMLAELDGNSTAQHVLGLLYGTGLGGVERDQAKSLLYHNFAAEQGNTRSEMTLAFRNHAGIGTSRDCNKAVDYYKRVADKAMKFWKSGPPGGHAFQRNAHRWVELTGGIYGEGASASSSGHNARQEGVIVANNLDDAFEYLSMRESAGDYGASFSLGKYYYDPPRGYKRNLRKAQRQFMKVARAYWGKDGKVNQKLPKNIEVWAGKAAAYIGRMFLRGEGMEQSYEKAITWFRRGISNGDSYAQYHIGIMYRDGLGLPQDGVKAATYLKAAAEQGLAVAQSALGVMFLDQGDIDTAGRYFELGASSGVMESLYYLAELNDKGVDRERNCGLATLYYKVVAERAEVLHSSFNEANSAYERGDYERALIPMLMAAEQGYENAQANAAHLLDRKTSMIKVAGVPLLSSPPLTSQQSKLLNNPALALAYYTRSARQTNVDSLVKMGDYYLAGDPTASAPATQESIAEIPNIEKSTTCYTTAAEGHRSAQALWNLGWMHENGIGTVPQDFHMAKRYYDLAYELNKEAYLPVKLALVKLRIRSWWNGVSGGKINGIKDEEGDDGRPKSFLEWLYRFLDAAEEMDAAEAAQLAQQNGDDIDGIYNEPGMPGGDSEYAARERERNADGYEGEWDDFDDGLVESLIIISLAGALAALVYARQQAQRRREEAARRGVGQVQDQQVAAPAGAEQLVGQQQPPPPPPQPPQEQVQQQERGLFPQPGDPDFNNWVVGGIGH